jgi:ATP-dependent Zn protease
VPPKSFKANEEKHREIAKYLLSKETITGEEFMKLFGKGKEKRPLPLNK